MTLSFLAALAAGVGAGSSAQSPAPHTPALKIVAFGDSLTSGHRLGNASAYPAVLARRLNEAGMAYTVLNRGVSGETTARGLRRLNAVLDEQPQILIVAFGANDGLAGVPVADVQKNLAAIIEAAQARGIKVLLCGMEALPLYGWQYTIDFHQMFPALAAKYQVPLVPFLLDRVIGDRALMSADGIHPNAEGARVLAENIWPYLLPLAQSVATASVGG